MGTPFASLEEFDTHVRRYQIRIRKRDSWRPDEVVIPAARVAVKYQCWREDVQVEPMVTLEADDGRLFTAGELLFKIHNAVVESLREIDHHYFEGLALVGWMENGEIPIYQLRLGS